MLFDVGDESVVNRSAALAGAAEHVVKHDGFHFRFRSHSSDVENDDVGSFVVAADAVGAGVGEVVLVATGSSARQTEATRDRPCDAVVMAIVDTWEVGGEEKFRK